MKVDTIGAIFELNQIILDEGWYELKPCDTIQTRHTQGINDMIQTNLNWIKNLEKLFSHTKIKLTHKDTYDTMRQGLLGALTCFRK